MSRPASFVGRSGRNETVHYAKTLHADQLNELPGSQSLQEALPGCLACLQSAPNGVLFLQVLILDEVSMISAEMFHQLEHHVRIIRGVDKPFGGVQLVLSGDYFQQVPVFVCNDAMPFTP